MLEESSMKIKLKTVKNYETRFKSNDYADISTKLKRIHTIFGELRADQLNEIQFGVC